MDSNKWVKKHGIVETGTAAWTLPGNIKNCKFIIHAVGPVWSDVRFSIYKNVGSKKRSGALAVLH